MLVYLNESCARGRSQLWLQAEPDYRLKKYRKACNDARLWQFCKQIYPEAALAQVYWAIGGHGIDWHRDASFANQKAYIINIGTVRLETELDGGRQIGLDLSGGEVIEFNCKLPHRSIPISEDRIGIAIWSDRIDIKSPENWL